MAVLVAAAASVVVVVAVVVVVMVVVVVVVAVVVVAVPVLAIVRVLVLLVSVGNIAIASGPGAASFHSGSIVRTKPCRHLQVQNGLRVSLCGVGRARGDRKRESLEFQRSASRTVPSPRP